MRICNWAVVILAMLMTINIATAGGIGTLTIGGDAQGKNGQTVSITIQATGVTDIRTFIVGMNFNNTVLSADKVTGGSLTSSKDIFAQSIDNNAGTVLAGVTSSAGLNGSGSIFVINFKVIGNVGSTSDLKLTVSANDTSANIININTIKITNGAFTVIDNVPTTTTPVTTTPVATTPAATTPVTTTPVATTPAATTVVSVEPLVGAYYFPTTGGSAEKWALWSAGGHAPPTTWNSNYLPDYSPGFDPNTELYSSKNVTIIKRQLELMKAAGIDFVIPSWWGQGDYTDQVLELIFTQVLSSSSNPYPDVKFAISYTRDGSSSGSIPTSDVINDINYIKNKYMNSPYYLKIGGKPVLFVYNFSSNAQYAQKWGDIRNQTGVYTVLTTFTNYESVAGLADSWYEYNTLLGFNQQGSYSAHISPGTHWPHYTPGLAREDFVRFETNAKALKDANVQFKLIESWNDWVASTGIEPAQKINHDDVNGFTEMSSYPSYGTKYIDILSKYFGSGLPVATTPAPTSATSVPTVVVTTASPTPAITAPPQKGTSSDGNPETPGGGGPGGGLSTPEPFDNWLEHEVRDHAVYVTPVSFIYSNPKLSIYEISVTSTQSGTASIRVETLKGTSKLVTMPASGIVYKDINIWIDYSRMKNATVMFKVENSWLGDNGLSDSDIRLSMWDNKSKKWSELSTNMIKKDANHTFFESRTNSLSSSFAISGVKKGESKTNAETEQKTNGESDNTSNFEIGVFISPLSFKSGYTDILDKIKSNNVTRIIVPAYEAKKGDDVHVFYPELKGLNISTKDSYSLDTLLTEAHNRGIEVFAEVSSFGPDAVMPTEDQKQNLKKIIGHLLDNYVDDKGMKLDGIHLDYMYYEEPYLAKGDTDMMVNIVKELSKEVLVGKSKLSASVKSAHYESWLHIYVWPYSWPLSGPSDYYSVIQHRGQDVTRLSRNLDFTSPKTYGKGLSGEDSNYVGKVTKFTKEKTDNGTKIIPNVQALGETKDIPNLKYVIESAKNNGARGVNVFDYNSISDNEWNVIKNAR